MPAATAPTTQPTTVPLLPMSGGTAGIVASPTVPANTLPVSQRTQWPVPQCLSSAFYGFRNFGASQLCSACTSSDAKRFLGPQCGG
eukprot:3815897-Rhodomonas_salina.1